MFLYKNEVKVATDPKMGLGLFAKESIPKGSMVWEFVEGIDIKIPVSTVEKMSTVYREYFKKYAWIEIGEEEFYYSSCDLSNFMNHSYDPNVGSNGNKSIALRDVHAGEELFIDYSSFASDFDEADFDDA